MNAARSTWPILIVVSLIVARESPAESLDVRLFEWQKGIGLASRSQPDMQVR